MGELFDGEGFVRGVRARAAGRGRPALVVGSGGSARPSRLAGWRGVARLGLLTPRAAMEALAERLRRALSGPRGRRPARTTGGLDFVVNASPSA